jgi:hypothetical protein
MGLQKQKADPGEAMPMPRFSARLLTQLEDTFDRFPWMLEQIKGFDFAETFNEII